MFVNVLALATALVLAEPSKPQFIVESRIVETQQNGLGHPKEKEAILPPKITVFDGQSASVGQTTQTPFLTAIKTATPGTKPANCVRAEGLIVPTNLPFLNQAKDPASIAPQTSAPIMTVVTEGLLINLTVTRIDDASVSLDATIQTANILEVKERVVDEIGTTIQSPKVEIVLMYAAETVRLGEKTTLSCGNNSNRSIEFVIRRYDETDQQQK
jgi:hypothetical protein